MSTYAWTIVKDHITSEGEGCYAVGVSGPRGASEEALTRLKLGRGFLFRMYDDDGILYYTGRLFDTTGEYGEEACYAPLGDFGMPGAGAVVVKYHGHPEMDCG